MTRERQEEKDERMFRAKQSTIYFHSSIKGPKLFEFLQKQFLVNDTNAFTIIHFIVCYNYTRYLYGYIYIYNTYMQCKHISRVYSRLFKYLGNDSLFKKNLKQEFKYF